MQQQDACLIESRQAALHIAFIKRHVCTCNYDDCVLRVVIDIDHSELPPLWKSNINFKMDILFSPRGTVIGPNVARGHIHFLITSLVDVTGTPHKAPGDPSKEDAETIVTITTQTGSVSTHSVFSLADPWRSAETGVETK